MAEDDGESTVAYPMAPVFLTRTRDDPASPYSGPATRSRSSPKKGIKNTKKGKAAAKKAAKVKVKK